MDTPVPDETHEKNLSASKVKATAQCPLKYWYQYISGETRTKPEAGYRDRGSAVHEAIEEVLRDDPTTRNSSVLASRFKREYRAWDPDIPEWMYDTGLKACDNAAKFLEKYDDLEIRDIEVRHEYIVGGEVNEQFTAIMDLCTERFIVDWKTGKRNDNDGNPREYNLRDEKIQGMVYAGAYLDKYGEYPEKVIFVYLGDGEIAKKEPSQDKWDEMKRYARNHVQMEQAEDFPAKPGGHCSFCDYEYCCPATDVSMGNISFWKY